MTTEKTGHQIDTFVFLAGGGQASVSAKYDGLPPSIVVYTVIKKIMDLLQAPGTGKLKS